MISSIAEKPIAGISLDLDNQWSYMKTHGDKGWESFPSYFSVLIPYVLDVLECWNLTITFFIVGQDAALNKNRTALNLLTQRGHEVGNHSYHHLPWLHLYTKEALKQEISEAEESIEKVTGQVPIGFRAPGFSWSPNLFDVLKNNGYQYDASTLPTYLGPLARMYYFWTSDLTDEEKEQRKALFGSFKEGLQPIKPYYWKNTKGNKLLELPVTTLPFFKTPFHLSYLLYLSRFSILLMRFYLGTAIFFCRMTNTEPSFLLHPLDLLGGDQCPELAFFPGMDIRKEQKLKVFNTVMKTLNGYFLLVNMSSYAKSQLNKPDLKTMNLKSA